MTDARAAASDDEAGSFLCRACGICCGGALFDHGTVLEEERERVARHLPVVQLAGREEHEFPIPCGAHGPAGCTIYEDRPETCKAYACALLGRLRRGEVALEAALGTVAELRAQIAAAEAALPPGSWLWGRAAHLRAAGEPGAVAERRRHAALLLDLKVLELRLARELDERVSSVSDASAGVGGAGTVPATVPAAGPGAEDGGGCP